MELKRTAKENISCLPRGYFTETVMWRFVGFTTIINDYTMIAKYVVSEVLKGVILVVFDREVSNRAILD